jgi:hypothetical protein
LCSCLPTFETAFTCVLWRRIILHLLRRDPHDVDRIPDYIGGALLAFGASGHRLVLLGLFDPLGGPHCEAFIFLCDFQGCGFGHRVL